MIRITYTDPGGRAETRTFRTLEEAQAFAHPLVGQYPDFIPACAVRGYGDPNSGRIIVEGAQLSELFPKA